MLAPLLVGRTLCKSFFFFSELKSLFATPPPPPHQVIATTAASGKRAKNESLFNEILGCKRDRALLPAVVATLLLVASSRRSLCGQSSRCFGPRRSRRTPCTVWSSRTGTAGTRSG
uniref:(northern house mosquito) hypothetical protein n=1 Tax=Culex pipiens TaxID=7175 RepID=A0A8D8CIZ9_CULPI